MGFPPKGLRTVWEASGSPSESPGWGGRRRPSAGGRSSICGLGGHAARGGALSRQNSGHAPAGVTLGGGYTPRARICKQKYREEVRPYAPLRATPPPPGTQVGRGGRGGELLLRGERSCGPWRRVQDQPHSHPPQQPARSGLPIPPPSGALPWSTESGGRGKATGLNKTEYGEKPRGPRWALRAPGPPRLQHVICKEKHPRAPRARKCTRKCTLKYLRSRVLEF